MAEFTIDDASTVLANLAAYANVLQEEDASMGAALKNFLPSLAAGRAVDAAAVWNALYAATAPVDPAEQGAVPDGHNGAA